MLFVFVDFDAGGEGVVRQALPVGIGALVELLAVHQELERSGNLLARALILVVLGANAPVDVRETGADAVLVTLQRVEVDGVSEVRGEDLVGLGFQPSPVGGEFCEFVGAGGEPFIEGCLDLRGGVGVLGLADADARVAVGDEAFCDRNGDRAAGASSGALPASGAGEVGGGSKADTRSGF